jgi:hypothetical protein
VGEGVRLFLALDLPADARAEIGRWRDALLSDREKLRTVDNAALHVTLVFLGRRPRARRPAGRAPGIGARPRPRRLVALLTVTGQS